MSALFCEIPVRRVPAVKPVPQVPGYQFRSVKTARFAHGFFKERADCTVRATMAALRLDYESAHALLSQLGRKNRSGFRIKIVADHLRWIPLDIHQGSVQKVVAGLPKDGRYVVRVSGHVTAVADGFIFDHPTVARKHVCQVWKIPVETGDYQI